VIFFNTIILTSVSDPDPHVFARSGSAKIADRGAFLKAFFNILDISKQFKKKSNFLNIF